MLKPSCVQDIALVPFGLLVNRQRCTAKRIEDITPQMYEKDKPFLYQRHAIISIPSVCCTLWAQGAWEAVDLEGGVLFVTNPGSKDEKVHFCDNLP